MTRYSVATMQLRRAALPLLFVSVSLAVFACDAAMDESTPCGRAKKLLGECGVIMPIESTGTCTGTAEALSNCLLTANGSCDDLAAVSAHLDQCAKRDGGAGLPDDFPGVSSTDSGAGVFDGGSSSLPLLEAGAVSNVDASAADARAPQADAGADAGLVFLFDQSGTVGAGEEQSFQTVRLTAGTYDFAANVTGSAALYVRKGFAATTATYDCKLSLPGDRCVMPVATSAILYVLVHGAQQNTQYRVTASQE